MNSAAFGGWERNIPGWRETLSKATGVCREAAHLRNDLATSGLDLEDGRGMTRASFWRKSRPRLGERTFLAGPRVRFHPQPPKAAAFISPARQRWERIVADGKPRRGDIKSNRLSKATGVCREAAYLRSGLAYLRTRFERDGRGMTRASFWRKFRPRLRRENFPRRASCVRFQHQPPKAAAFISPARQRWGKDRVGREAPEGRHQIKSAFVADPPVGRSRR
jgi:hypothetical protein